MAKQRRKKTRVQKPTAPASFVFRGTVVQRGAATLDQVPLTRDTLVVTVDEIIDGPDVLLGFTGKDITVQLTRGLRATTGSRYIFHTNGWIYGAGLAVVCVALTPDSDADMRKSRQATETTPVRAIQARADRAEMVVTGEVTEVRRASEPRRRPITEHDPEWRQAVIAVDSMPKASTARARKPKQVLIRFAASRDVQWAEAPKFSVGDGGVWMLGDTKQRREQEALRTAAGAKKNEYLVVDPEDFFPMEVSERVLSLINA